VDISDTVAAKSDQMNADDLIGGAITVTIERVTIAEGEQPVSVFVAGYQPWKPCKTMRRLLLHCWGKDHASWSGRRLMLYRDETVQWGGKEVGGIRIKAMSHIDRGVTVMLTAREGGKKAAVHVDVLRDERPRNDTPVEPMALDKFLGWISAASKRGWTSAHLASLFGVDRAEDVPPDARRAFVATLKGAPPSEDDPPTDDDANARAAARDAAEFGKGGAS